MECEPQCCGVLTRHRGGSVRLALTLSKLPGEEAGGYLVTLMPATEPDVAPSPVPAQPSCRPAPERDRFLAVLEHELRNPLAPILAWTEVLKREPAQSSRMRRAVSAIERSVQQQRARVDDLLDLASIHNGNPGSERQPVAVAPVLAECVARFDARTREKNISLQFPLHATDEDAQPELPAEAGRKVLLVEDRDDTREALRALLESWGLCVAEASDGAQGVKLAREFAPDLILCDLSMPVLDGWGLARELRSLTPPSRIPIIALSGHGTPGDIRQSLDAGFEAHLVKPCDAQALLMVLNRFLPAAAPLAGNR